VIVTFTDRPSELTGTVTVPSGSPADAAVVIFPADTTAWTEFGINARRLRMARPGQNGTFMFGSPPPGDYFIVAFREEYAVEWQDPAFLEQLSRVASRITLLEGERRTVDVAFHDVRPPGERYRESATGYRELSPRDLADTAPDVVASGPFVPDEPAPEPQVRDRSVEAARPGTGVITGVVVLQADSSPVRRARVSVMSPETRTQRTAITDDAGRFAIASLPPGRYTLSVSKPAHLTSYHGSRIPGRGPGTPIELAAGQQVTGITMPIQRGGVVSGVVVDAFGQPYPGVRVRLMRFVMRDGDRTLQQIGAGGTGTTNDRGAYRLYGIMPGSYVVAVTAPVSTTTETLQLSAEDINAALSELQQSQTTSVTESGTQVSTTRRTIAPAPPGTVSQIPRSGRPLGYAAFFYPGTPMEHEAVPVTVTAGEELSGVDVPMQLVPTARIEGTLLAPDGQPATRASLTLMTTIAGATTSRSVRTLPNGRFQAIGVPPGRYTLTARMIQQPPRPPMPPGAPSPAPVALRTQGSQLAYWAQQELDINGEDVNDLSLTLAEAMTISGRVVFDARTEKPPVGAGAVRVALEPLAASRFGFSARPAGTDAAGNFTITGVTPGRYRLNATVIGGAPASPIAASAGLAGPRWMMKSTAIDGRDFVDSAVEIRGGDHLTGVVIALTDQVTEISGAILDATGAPVPDLTVVLFPADRAAWTSGSRRLRPPIRSTDGKFRMTALPPGEYLLAVATEIDPGDWGDPAYMEQLAAAAIRISLAEGEKKVQNVRVGG
jgi:protocatechuate 3,4-dioxygenase beta subunit